VRGVLFDPFMMELRKLEEVVVVKARAGGCASGGEVNLDSRSL
jgi:hypothetical protein